jgi:hypothetical protein
VFIVYVFPQAPPTQPIQLERQIVTGAEYPSAPNQIQISKRLYLNRPAPSDFKDIRRPTPSRAEGVDLDQLIRVRGQGHEEEHPFCAPVEREGISLLDDDRLFIDDVEYLI